MYGSSTTTTPLNKFAVSAANTYNNGVASLGKTVVGGVGKDAPASPTEQKQNFVLLWWNVAKAIAMAILAVVALAVGLNYSEPPFPIDKTTSILEGTPQIVDISKINIVPWSAAVPIAHTLYAIVMAILSTGFYHQIIVSRFNVVRWIAYALSQPFQVFVVVVVIGSSELDSVVMFTISNFLSIGLLLLIEQNSKVKDTVYVSSLIWGLIAAVLIVHLGTWALIFDNSYAKIAFVPNVLQALVIGVFVFITFIQFVNIMNTMLLYCKQEDYYIYIEWTYQILDVVNVVYFILVIVIGLTTVVIP